MLITDEYRKLNSELHETNELYGTSGHRCKEIIAQLVTVVGSRDILDYGCGKRTLEKALGYDITNYDPAIPGLDQAPEPHDIVACTDVLEHIEPDCLDDVLRDLRRCTKQAGFFLIATGPAMKVLSDGRNAHLIQQPFDWWKARLEAAGFRINQVHPLQGEFAVICK